VPARLMVCAGCSRHCRLRRRCRVCCGLHRYCSSQRCWPPTITAWLVPPVYGSSFWLELAGDRLSVVLDEPDAEAGTRPRHPLPKSSAHVFERAFCLFVCLFVCFSLYATLCVALRQFKMLDALADAGHRLQRSAASLLHALLRARPALLDVYLSTLHSDAQRVGECRGAASMLLQFATKVRSSRWL